MLSINETVSLKQILAVKPQFILAVNYDANLGNMLGEDTSSDMQAVYAHNIDSLPNGSYQVWAYDLDDGLHTVLIELIENQPIYDIPAHYTIEAY